MAIQGFVQECLYFSCHRLRLVHKHFFPTPKWCRPLLWLLNDMHLDAILNCPYNDEKNACGIKYMRDNKGKPPSGSVSGGIARSR